MLSVIFRAEIIRERKEAQRKVDELAVQLAGYKRSSADCWTSAQFYKQEAERLSSEAQQKTDQANQLTMEARRLAQQL